MLQLAKLPVISDAPGRNAARNASPLAGGPDDPATILTTFGDVLRVPRRKGTPLERQAPGADVRMVYSPLDALRLARGYPDRQVVFFAIGFETTAPSTALTLQQARRLGVTNFSVFCNHVTIVPALCAILDSPDMRLDAFIGPGHVSAVIGCRPYVFVARDYGKPLVSGFEPLDVLQSIIMILRQLREGRAEVENQYARVWCPGRAIFPPCGRSPTCSSCGRSSNGVASASSRSRP